ncbi:MAG: hypothetical protein AAFR26_02120 [Cyanobacteria bacterium J06626_4]
MATAVQDRAGTPHPNPSFVDSKAANPDGSLAPLTPAGSGGGRHEGDRLPGLSRRCNILLTCSPGTRSLGDTRNPGVKRRLRKALAVSVKTPANLADNFFEVP